MNTLTRARGAFADLLNALDDARAAVTARGEDVLDELVAEIERSVRRFDRAFCGDALSPREVQDQHLATFGEGHGK